MRWIGKNEACLKLLAAVEELRKRKTPRPKRRVIPVERGGCNAA